MPDLIPVRISGLPALEAPVKREALIPMVQDGVTVRTAVEQLAEALAGTADTMFFATRALAVAATIPAEVQAIFLMGYSKAGDGGEALYGRVLVQPTHGGKMQTADGAWWELSEGQQVVPKMFGAPLNGVDDDAPAIQAAEDYIEQRQPGITAARRRGGFIHLRGRRYMMRSSVVINPVRCGIDGEGAFLDCSLLPNMDPAAQPELVTNGDGAAGSTGWTQGDIASIPWTFGNGLRLDPVTEQGSFGIIGQKIAVAAGAKVVVTLVLARNMPMGTQRYVNVALRTGTHNGTDRGPGYGGGVFQVIRPEILEGSPPQTFEINLTAPGGSLGIGPWLSVQSNNIVTIASIGVKVVPNNTALIFRTPPPNAGEQFGHAPYEIRNLRMVGIGNGTAGWGHQTALELDTEHNFYSTRITVRNVEVRGFKKGIVFGTRTYICQFYSCGFYGNWDSIVTRTGTQDSGENIVFYGCTISGANRAIYNPENMNLRFDNCSIDYVPVVYEGGGLCVIVGGWIEKRFNNQLNLPNNPAARGKPWFDIYENSAVYIIGATLMQATQANDNDDPEEQYIFYGRNKYSRVEMEIQGFNLRTVSGAWMGGSGQCLTHRIRSGGGNKRFSTMPKEDALHDLLGGAGHIRGDQTSLPFPVWLRAEGSYSTYSASGTTVFTGVGNAPLTSLVTKRVALAGDWKVTMTSAGGTGATYQVVDPKGRFDGVGAIGTRYEGTIAFNLNMTLNPAPVNHAIGDRWVVTINPDYGRVLLGLIEGPRRVLWTLAARVSSTVTATVGDTTSGAIALTKENLTPGFGIARILLPVRQDAMHTVRLKTKVVGVAGEPATTANVFFTGQYVRITATDSEGNPAYDSSRVVTFTEVAVPYTRDIGTDGQGVNGWVDVQLSSLYSDESTPDNNNCYCPRWATNLLLQVNYASSTSGLVVYVDNIEVYPL